MKGALPTPEEIGRELLRLMGDFKSAYWKGPHALEFQHVAYVLFDKVKRRRAKRKVK